MPKFELQLKVGSSEGLKSLRVNSGDSGSGSGKADGGGGGAFSAIVAVNLECGSCGEAHDKPVTVDSAEEIESESKGHRSSSNFVWKCKMCRREGSLSIVESASGGALIMEAEEGQDDGSDEEDVVPKAQREAGGWATLVELEARGSAVVKSWEPGMNELTAVLRSGREVAVDLARDGGEEWCDYDDDAGTSLGLYEVESRVQ